jgi:DNA polymerase I-like protein with 3'-5' exonuclease and polymerase domains
MINKKYVCVSTKEDIKNLVDHIKSYDLISIDTETNSLNPRKGKIIGLSISAIEGYGYYLPTLLYDKESNSLIENTVEGVSCHDIAKKILNLLHGKKLIAHNFSFDGRFIKCFYGIDLLSSLHADTMLLVHTVNEDGAGFGSNSPFGLKSIAKMIQKELGLDIDKAANEEQIALKDSIKKNGGSVTRENYEIWKADIDILSEYAAADTDLTLRIYNHFIKELYAQGLEKFFFEDEVMPLYKEVTIPMEEKGVRLDMDLIRRTKEEVTVALEDHRKKVVDELLSYAEVKHWIMIKAADAFPANNRGTFASQLIEQSGIEFPKSSKTGKYNITNANLLKIEDGPLKQFLLHGDKNILDKDQVMKIQLKLWKESNDDNWFNIQSKDQLGEIAFGALGIKHKSTTKTGKPQFDDDMIQIIGDTEEWAKNLRIYNKLLKIRSTYIERFLDGEEDGRYYFYYKQHGTVSGRYGSDAQQLPRPKEEGDDDPIVIEYNNRVRAFFIPDEHNIFIDDDYESLEPHVFAHVSGDDGLKDIFRNGWDFYSTIAIKTEKLDQYSPDKKADNYLRKLAPKLRNKAKAYALGIPYGMGAYALGKNIEVSTKEAKKLVDGYLSGFPELEKWMRKSENDARNLGYVKTQVGRIRHLPKVKAIYEQIGDAMLDYNIKKELAYSHGEEVIKNLSRDFINGLNNAKNVQIQGLSASIVNRAALAINRRFKESGIKGWVCAQIHDQIICEVEHDRAKEAAEIVQDCMENTTKLSLKLKAVPALAPNWRDGH